MPYQNTALPRTVPRF
jgi:hypothetical protein